ncbi:MAG: hypothetical protein OQL19_02550 [Gammaproteobacteria bacterium]|nr:hypothetical protein [Gammaproteobacteria bacterium]
MVVINVETELWNQIISYCIKNDWHIKYKYDLFDAGIDYDLIVLSKDDEKLMFGWDNWFEGEIEASEEIISEFEEVFAKKLTPGEASSLKPSVIKLFYNESSFSNKIMNFIRNLTH